MNCCHMKFHGVLNSEKHTRATIGGLFAVKDNVINDEMRVSVADCSAAVMIGRILTLMYHRAFFKVR